jgi:hypothetical protein
MQFFKEFLGLVDPTPGMVWTAEVRERYRAWLEAHRQVGRAAGTQACQAAQTLLQAFVITR